MNPDIYWKSTVGAFKAITRFMESLSLEQREQLVSGKAKLVCELQPSGSNPKSRSEGPAASELVSSLSALSSREEAQRQLASPSVTRKSLQDALRQLDVPVDKADNMERLRDKLLERTIGYRLRSQAIQGGGNNGPQQ